MFGLAPGRLAVTIGVSLLGACGRIAFEPIGDSGAIDAPTGSEAALSCVGGDAHVEDTAGHCFMLFNTSRAWLTAEQECTTLGASTHLATISGVEQNDVVMNLASIRVWTGGNDLLVTTQFQWTSGEPFAFTNWAAGEPSSGNCIELIGNGNGTWNAQDCASTRPYVCERI